MTAKVITCMRSVDSRISIFYSNTSDKKAELIPLIHWIPTRREQQCSTFALKIAFLSKLP